MMEQYYAIVTPTMSAEGRLDQLNNSALDSLQNISESDDGGIAVGKARSILALNASLSTYFEPILDNTGQYKTARATYTSQRQLKPESGFDLYPNPANDYVILQWKWLDAGLSDAFEINIRDSKGALVKHEQVQDYQANTQLIKLGELTPGMYFMNVEQGDNVLYRTKITILD